MEAKLKAEKAKKVHKESFSGRFPCCEAFEKKLEEEKKRLEAKREARVDENKKALAIGRKGANGAFAEV